MTCVHGEACCVDAHALSYLCSSRGTTHRPPMQTMGTRSVWLLGLSLVSAHDPIEVLGPLQSRTVTLCYCPNRHPIPRSRWVRNPSLPPLQDLKRRDGGGERKFRTKDSGTSGNGRLEAESASPASLASETGKSQVAQMQTCQEQPFLPPRRSETLDTRPGVPDLGAGQKVPSGDRREPVALRSLGSAGLALGAPRGGCPGTARPCPERGIRPRQREGCREGGRGDDSAVFLSPQGKWPDGESVESLTASGSVPGRRHQSGRINFWSQSRRPPSSLLLSLQPAWVPAACRSILRALTFKP